MTMRVQLFQKFSRRMALPNAFGRLLPSSAAIATLLLAGCGSIENPRPCSHVSTSPAGQNALDISFHRRGAPRNIVVHMEWAAPAAPFYTQYGPLRSLTVAEGATVVAVPRESISQIEDFWPELITMRSARSGSYELSIPMGVPVAVPEIVHIRSGRFAGIRTADSFYPLPPRRQ